MQEVHTSTKCEVYIIYNKQQQCVCHPIYAGWARLYYTLWYMWAYPRGVTRKQGQQIFIATYTCFALCGLFITYLSFYRRRPFSPSTFEWSLVITDETIAHHTRYHTAVGIVYGWCEE